jgi:hypothetical protein
MYYPAPMQIFKATNDIKNLWSYVSESGWEENSGEKRNLREAS